MTKEEILAITESDKEGCETLNRLVHKKLGLCTHEDSMAETSLGDYLCKKCKRYYSSPFIPDYTHSIEAAWAIGEWLSKNFERYPYIEAASQELEFSTRPIFDFMWASALDRCKAFLLMDSDETSKETA